MSDGYVIPEALTPTLISGTVHVSRELLDDALSARGLLLDMLTAPLLTPEQAAELQRQNEERRASQQTANNAAWQRLIDAGGVIAAVAELHQPSEYGHCYSCASDDYAEDWPCGTAQILIEHLEAQS